MKEFLSTINDWMTKGTPFGMATVVKTWGASPRPTGSVLLVSKEMEMVGSVSGGCVEGAVIKATLPLIESGQSQLLDFGITNEEAWGVGLSCGGKVKVYAERFPAFDQRPAEQMVWQQLQQKLTDNQPCILLTRLQAGESQHFLVMPDRTALGQQLPDGMIDEAIRVYQERQNQIIELASVEYFAQVFAKKSQLFIIGAAHITVDLVTLGKMYGFETIVIDPRGIFTNKTQFTTPPDQLYEKYPAEVLPDYDLDAQTYAVVLSHDPKIDDNALHILLKSDVAYIGALGSRKTQAKRIARLQEAGFEDAIIAKIHSPVGLAIKAKTPREIALSITAELILTKNG
ncbi:MAG: XdhC family protein [Bacteroidota bacterium]